MTPKPLTPRAERRFQLILWAAMLFSLGMYFVIIRVVHPGEPVDNPLLVRILLAASAFFALGSFGVRKAFEARARSQKTPELQRIGFMIGMVMSEAAALFGVVAWFVTATELYFVFLIIGFVSMLFHYPQRAE
jgi:hypothetical protein